MNVNPVSFGRTIKVNAPVKVAEHAADLINSVPNKKGESRVQQQLKTLFHDSRWGRARVVAPYGKHGDVFILTGTESEEVAELIKDRRFQLSKAKENYGKDSDMYGYVKDAEDARYNDLLKLAIHETQEPIELNLEYCNRKHRIKSMNIVF